MCSHIKVRLFYYNLSNENVCGTSEKNWEKRGTPFTYAADAKVVDNKGVR